MKKNIILLLLVSMITAASVAAQNVYKGTGVLNRAESWSKGLPVSGNVGHILTTDHVPSVGNQWGGMSVRLEGGRVADFEDAGLYLVRGSVFELAADADYSDVDVDVSGTLKLWSDTGVNSELRILSGRVEAGALYLVGHAVVYMKDGLLHAGAFLKDSNGIVNFMSGGTGEVIIDNQASTKTGGLYLNFETDTRARFTLGQNDGVSSISSIRWMIANGRVSIDAVAVTELSKYEIVQDGLSVTLSLLP